MGRHEQDCRNGDLEEGNFAVDREWEIGLGKRNWTLWEKALGFNRKKV